MIAKTVVNKPVTILVLFVLILGIGAYVSSGLDIDLYPEMDPPVLLVFTEYDGAGPEQVEEHVTRILEGNLTNVTNIKEIRSTSQRDQSMVILEFEWGEDLAEAAADARDKIEFVTGMLPDEAESPQLLKFDPSMQPIVYLTLMGNKNEIEMYELADDIVVPRLEQIAGVASASISGLTEPIVRIEADQNRLDAFGLTLTGAANGLFNKISTQNTNTSGGEIDDGKKAYLVKTTGEYSSLEEIADTVVSVTPTGNMVRLSDLAEVKMGQEDLSQIVTINGQRSMSIPVRKQSGGNSVAVADSVLARVGEINRDLPAGVRLEVLYDSTKMIRSAIDSVVENLFSGMALAMAVLFLFLRVIKSTLIIGLSIPISLLITMTCMYFAGLTLNMLTMTGLVLGLGMIVDSSIVVLENVFSYREKGAKHKTAAILGATEMIGAITGSTLTTVCVFIPVIMFRSELEFLGVLTGDLAFTIVIALMSSLFVAVTLVPVLCSTYLKLTPRSQNPIRIRWLAKVDDWFAVGLDKLDSGYRALLKRCLDNRWVVVGVVFLFFVASIMIIPYLGFDFMPPSSDDSVTLEMTLPEGTRVETTMENLEALKLIVDREVTGTERIIYTAGSSNGVSAAETNVGTIQFILPEFDERTTTVDGIKAIMRPHFYKFPDAVFSFTERSMGGSSHDIDIVIKTDDLDKGKRIGLEIIDLLKEHVPDVLEPDIDMKDGLPQAEIIINRQKAYALGIDMYSAGREILASVDGIQCGYYRTGGDEYEIHLMFREEDRANLVDLETITVSNSSSQKIPVASFATVEVTEGPVTINREDQIRVIHIEADMSDNTSLSEVTSQIKAVIDRYLILDDDVIITYGGDYEDMQNIGMKLIAIVLIALALVFGVMASQFEDLLNPFIIFLSMFTMSIGVVGVYLITGQAMSTFSIMGVVMLLGMVVNNGIVLVDYTNLLVSRGMPIYEACIAAGGSRLRPVLMTTLTTILGMYPLAVSEGEGSTLIQPIGLTILGGMTTNTIMTLVLVPCLYYIFNKTRYERRQQREKARRRRELENRRLIEERRKEKEAARETN